jgi:hypothetical protein
MHKPGASIHMSKFCCNIDDVTVDVLYYTIHDAATYSEHRYQ